MVEIDSEEMPNMTLFLASSQKFIMEGGLKTLYK